MPDLSPEPATLLACPRCGAGLDDLHCRACNVDFPVHGGVPWLFADPGAAISDWQNRFRLALERIEEDAARVRQALGSTSRPTTRCRLETLLNGYGFQSEHLKRILAPLTLAEGGSLETLLALRTRLPPTQSIVSYDANVHRDWAWGTEECRMALEAIVETLGDSPAGRVLVLGAGAGRLAYDLHQHRDAGITVALDLNPLLAYVGRAVSRGETVSLVEFPLAPRRPRDAAVERALRAPEPARPGLEFVLADAMRAPFVPGTFDVVVTPWLLDVIGEPAGDVLPRINALLRDGGVWIHQGSVAFEGPDPAARLTLDELVEMLGDAGLSDPHTDARLMPYMDCPDSRHGRLEEVVTVRARKTAEVKPPPRHHSLPDWIVEGRKPVPALPAFQTQAMTTRMHAFLMSLIDGRRSVKDMARVLEEQRLMPHREAEVALKGFLTTMYDEAQGGSAPR